jgi:hypothetical protein
MLRFMKHSTGVISQSTRSSLKSTAITEAERLHECVITARSRLRDVEDRHERGLESGSRTEVVEIGRGYAAAVQDYLHAVIAWLSWLKRNGYQR